MKLIKEDIVKVLGFEPSEDFIELIREFSIKFNGIENAFIKIANYFGGGSFESIKEDNTYENIPIEAELFFDTGGDGELYGFLNIAPEIQNFKKPLISFTPGNGLIIFFGNGIKKGVRNLINYNYDNYNFEKDEILFLTSLNFLPFDKKYEPLFINYSLNQINEIPLNKHNNYKYEITLDGVGVFADKKHFINKNIIKKNGDNLITSARNLINKYPASSLVILKNELYKFFRSPASNPDQYLKLLKLIRKAYKNLDKKSLEVKTNNEIKFIERGLFNKPHSSYNLIEKMKNLFLIK